VFLFFSMHATCPTYLDAFYFIMLKIFGYDSQWSSSCPRSCLQFGHVLLFSPKHLPQHPIVNQQ
jgi:hypothetical protein